jgi:hypothetical protein
MSEAVTALDGDPVVTVWTSAQITPPEAVLSVENMAMPPRFGNDGKGIEKFRLSPAGRGAAQRRTLVLKHAKYSLSELWQRVFCHPQRRSGTGLLAGRSAESLQRAGQAGGDRPEACPTE